MVTKKVVWKKKAFIQIKDGVNGSFARLSPKIANKIFKFTPSG